MKKYALKLLKSVCCKRKEKSEIGSTKASKHWVTLRCYAKECEQDLYCWKIYNILELYIIHAFLALIEKTFWGNYGSGLHEIGVALAVLSKWGSFCRPFACLHIFIHVTTKFHQQGVHWSLHNRDGKTHIQPTTYIHMLTSFVFRTLHT